MAVLGLSCFASASLVGMSGSHPGCGARLLAVQVSSRREHRLQVPGFSSCGTGLVVPRRVGPKARPRDRVRVPALAVQISATDHEGRHPQFSFSCVCV